MRILFLARNQRHRYNRGHQLFRDEIGRQHDVVYYGPGFPTWPHKEAERSVDAVEVVEEYKPDMVMTYSMKYSYIFKNLESIKGIPNVHFVDDLTPTIGNFPGYLKPYTRYLMTIKFDLCFCRTSRALDIVEGYQLAKNTALLPFSVDTNLYKKADAPKNVDVYAGMSTVNQVYPRRSLAIRAVKQSKHHTITKRLYKREYIETLQRSKITVNSLDAWDDFNLKMLEGPACGALLLTERPTDFKVHRFNKNNCVIYHSPSEIQGLLSKYLKDDEKRERIADNGYRLVHKRHSNERRVKEMTSILEKQL